MSPDFADLPFAALLAQASPPPQAAGPQLLLAAFVLPPVVLLVAALALVTVRWFMRRRQLRAAAGPSCGRCGYLVQGLTTFTCPECGSDLRQVGIVGGAADRGGRPTSRPMIFFKTVGWKLLVVA